MGIRFVTLVTVIVLILQMSCSMKHKARNETLGKGARVGVLFVSKNGDHIETSLGKAYMATLLIEKGLDPVALNEADVRDLYELSSKELVNRNSGGLVNLSGGAVTKVSVGSNNERSIDPILAPEFCAYLSKINVEYVLIVHVRSYGVDERLHGILLRAKDGSIVAAHAYWFSFMKQFCIPMTFALGVSVVICPWFFLRDQDKATYGMLEDMLEDMVDDLTK